MVWTLVRRGLVVGVVAGLLAGAFAFVFGEPRVQDAIEIEEASSAHASLAFSPPVGHISDWVVNRDEQRGGLFLATALYGIAVGGLSAVGFALLRGRGAERTDWQLSTRLAAALFVAFALVPFIKYPPNPPAVGNPETIGDRTEYYLILLAGSLLALLAAARVVWSIRDEAQPWVRPVLGAATFTVLAGGLALALPGVQEVPPDFPAPLIWEFRLSSLGTQAVLWAVLGIGFGIASHRASGRPVRT
ncbi:MAG: CbtA family protein [Thermoleophilaceae bacterium]